MNNYCGGCASFRRDFIFVSPAPVKSHGPAAKHFLVELGRIIGVGNGWIIDQHQNCFPPHLDILVVIPSILGRHDAVTDKDDVGIFDFDLILKPSRRSDVIVWVTERRRFAAGHKRRVRHALNSGERNLLKIGAVGISWL